MPLLQAQFNIVQKSLQQKMQYILRFVPCGDRGLFLDLGARYDKLIISVLNRVCNRELTARAETVAFLPQSMGGFGLKSFFNTADAAYTASYVYAATVLPKIFPDLAPNFPHPSLNTTFAPKIGGMNIINIAETVMDAEGSQNAFPKIAKQAIAATARLNLATSGESTKRTQNGSSLGKIFGDIMKYGDLERLGDIVSDLENKTDEISEQLLARFLSARGDQYTWNTLPTDKLTTLENHQARIAALQRLLEPIIPKNNRESTEGTRLITCSKCNKSGE